MLFVRFVDDGLIDGRLHFGAMAQPVVHPHFYVVGVMRREFADVRAGLLWILGTVAKVGGTRFACIFEKTMAPGKHPRSASSPRMVSVCYTVNRVFILSKGCDSSYAVREVFVELLDHVFLGVVPGD